MFLNALENCDLVPVADPNTPSHMHRMAKGVALDHMATQNPTLYDRRKVDGWIGQSVLKIADFDQFFAPPQPPGQAPDPQQLMATAKLITAQTQASKAQADAQNAQAELADKAAQRQSDQDIATVDLSKEMIIHGSDVQRATQDHALNVAKAHAAHGLAAGGQVHDQMHKDRTHALDLSKHHLEASVAAHEAAIKTHQVLNPPEPSPAKGGKTK